MLVTILRGISGSGKSTWTKDKQATIVSADHFFMVDGTYQFDPSKLAENHRKCFHSFMEAILRKDTHIIVDNTNISAWEFSPYVLAAEAYGYQVELLTLECPPGISHSRKQLVPEEQLVQSSKRLAEETKRMPGRFKTIHRLINTCEPKA